MSQAGLVSEAGTGTVTNFSFTNANGFDGTVTNPTTTPNLTLNTTVADTRVMFSNSGAITGDAEMTYNSTTNVLTISNLTASGNLQQSLVTTQAAATAVNLVASSGGVNIQSGGNAANGPITISADGGAVATFASTVSTALNAVGIQASLGGINLSCAKGVSFPGLYYGGVAVSTTPYSLTYATYLYKVDSTAGAITLNLPSTDPNFQGLTFIIYHSAGANSVIIDAAGTNLIRLGNTVSSAGGTATSALIGDSITITYNDDTGTWIATSVIGTWTLA